MKRHWMVAGVLVGFVMLSLAVVTPAPADDTKATGPDVENAKKVAETVQTIHLANELADHGRKQKSALQLLTAATLLSRTGVIPSKMKPKVELPEGMKPSEDDDKEAPPASMKAEAARLLDEAEKHAKGNVTLLEAIRAARDSKLEEIEGSRGGNPRSFSRSIRQGVTHSFSVRMVPGTHCIASLSGNGRNRFTLSVTGAGGVRHGAYSGPNPSISWNAGRQPSWNISVTNNGPGVGQYTLSHN